MGFPEHLGVAGLRFARCRGVQGLLFEFCRSRLRVSLRYLRYGFTAQVWQKLRGLSGLRVTVLSGVTLEVSGL